MKVLRIILGIFFAIVIVRGIVLLGDPNGTLYPVVAIAAGAIGCLVVLLAPKKKDK